MFGNKVDLQNEKTLSKIDLKYFGRDIELKGG